MAEISTVQQRLEEIAEQKFNKKINDFYQFINQTDTLTMLRSIKLEDINNLTIKDLEDIVKHPLLKERARQRLLPGLIADEVKSFMAKVDSLSEQIDELRDSIEGSQY